MTGLIDELEIFGRALTQTEVQAIYLADVAGKCKCAPLPPNMVAWWPLDELTGGTATDSVGGNNGTHVNGPTPLAGEYVNNSLCFDGSNDFVDVPSAAPLNFGTRDFSIDAWVKRDPASPNSPPSVIVDKRNSVSGVGYSLSVSFGRLVFLMSGTNYVTLSSPVPPDGQWHFVAVTVNRTTGVGQFYADCFPLDTFTPLALPANLDNTNVFRIGAGLLAGNQPWRGCIDELELFNRALTLQEIQSICRAGSLGKCKCTDPPSDMVAWWPLDETGPSTAEDIAGTNDGTHECSVTFGPGKVGGAYRLTRANGAKGRVAVPPSQFNFGFGSFTIDAWIKPEPCSLLPNPIPTFCYPRIIVGALQQHPTSPNNSGFEFLVDNGKLGLRVPTQTILSNVSAVVDNQWQHVAVRVDRTATTNLSRNADSFTQPWRGVRHDRT